MGFFDGGGKSLSFGEVGSQAAAAAFNVWRGGIITDVGDAKQATDYTDQSKLRTWPNGDPVMQLPITLDTGRGKCPERPESADDDLIRTLYVTKGGSMFAAAKAALRAAKADDFYVGGSLYIRWVSGEGRKGDPRQYEIYYEAPVGNSGGFMEEPAQPGPAPAMPPQVGPQGGGFQPGQPAPSGPPAGQPGAPPQPVWNAATNSWDLPTTAPAPTPASPPPPPEPVWNGTAWVMPSQQPAPQPSGPPPGAAPAGGPAGPQGPAQPAGNPFARQ